MNLMLLDVLLGGFSIFMPHFVLQAREKYLALRKSTRMDIAATIEEVSSISCPLYMLLILTCS